MQHSGLQARLGGAVRGEKGSWSGSQAAFLALLLLLHAQVLLHLSLSQRFI